jgi:hypothetical protein
MANWKDGKFFDRSLGKEVHIPRASFVTTLDNLARNSRVSLRSLRTALLTLSKLGILTKRSTQQATYVSILNFKVYQDSPTRGTTEQLTFDRHITDKRPTRIEEVEDVQKGKNTPSGGPAAPGKGNFHDLAGAVVAEYKRLKGIADSPRGDAKHKEAHLALATELIGTCSSYEDAIACLKEKGAGMDAAERFHWNLETIVNKADEWLADRKRKNGTGKQDGGKAMDTMTARAALARLLTPIQRDQLRAEERTTGQLAQPFYICQRFGLKPSPITPPMEGALLALRRHYNAQLTKRRREADPDYSAPSNAAVFYSELTIEEVHDWEDFVLAESEQQRAAAVSNGAYGSAS